MKIFLPIKPVGPHIRGSDIKAHLLPYGLLEIEIDV